jgi:hypothetical protein
MCNKSIICGVLFASGAIAFYEGNNMLFALLWFVWDGSKVSRISNFVVLSFSVITDDLTSSSKDQNVFCIVNCKEDYDHLKLACKLTYAPGIFPKILSK